MKLEKNLVGGRVKCSWNTKTQRNNCGLGDILPTPTWSKNNRVHSDDMMQHW